MYPQPLQFSKLFAMQNKTTDHIKILYRGGYDDKFYIKIFGIYPIIDL